MSASRTPSGLLPCLRFGLFGKCSSFSSFPPDFFLLSVGSARVVGPSVRVDSMGFGPYCWYRAQERLHFLYESRLAVGKSSEGFQALQQSTPGPASRLLLHRWVRLIVPRYYLIPVSTFIVPHLRVQISWLQCNSKPEQIKVCLCRWC
jgi:hypothetical protein